MKCLVFSDSHGQSYYVDRVVSMHRDAEAVFFLGDGLSDIEPLTLKYKEMAWLLVRGNCDGGIIRPDVSDFGSVTLFERKIIYTHGHRLGVKYGYDTAFEYARQNRADVLLFGHTHKQLEKYSCGVYLFNPGSISGKGGVEPGFGVMNISREGVLFSHGVVG